MGNYTRHEVVWENYRAAGHQENPITLRNGYISKQDDHRCLSLKDEGDGTTQLPRSFW